MNVKFFLDTADLAEIEEAASWGALAGVTTNPTLYSRIGASWTTSTRTSSASATSWGRIARCPPSRWP